MIMTTGNPVDQSWTERIASVEGVTDDERAMLRRLVDEYERHKAGNSVKLRYYNDDVDVSKYDSRVPKKLKRVKVKIGACSKAVNMLARRSIFDGFTVEGGSDALDECLDANGFAIQYAMAVPSELIFGSGVWTLSPAYEDGDPSCVVNFHDFMESSAVWDFRKRRVKYGMVIEDMARREEGGKLEPVCVVLHTSDSIVVMRSDGGTGAWQVTQRIPNPLRQPMMVAMRYQPTNVQPFGKSRVSASMRSLTVQMMLATYNLMAHDQYAAIPTKWLLGLSDDQFDALAQNEQRLDAKSILLGTTNEDGGTPTAGMWNASGVAEHTQVLESIAQRMSSESDLPLSAFGVLGSTYTSSDALNASSHDLVILAESLNRSNADALRLVAKMAMCVAGGKTMDMLTDAERDVTVHFRDPSMLSASQVADAMLKISSTVDGFGGTDVCLERLGFDEDERRRIRSQLASSRQLGIAERVLGGANGANNAE